MRGTGLNGKDNVVKTVSLLFSLALAIAPCSAMAVTNADAKAKAVPEAEIPFANHGGIWSWTTGNDDRTIYFEDQHRQWYKATLIAPAIDLPFTLGMRIDTGPVDTLDKWGAVYVGHQRYPFQSFEKVAGPPERPKKAKKSD